ncbi:MAG: hypothetical protein EZS28_007680 [Streblomastix strix]|uniref:Uncharacterized protein n=1 Tax=Streblomastix strix TaxID=222440 RepID=A0A5J4WNX3_9EUKA|nr:MAG: hypothetical protein EZS28_007680 [Streblomastix strix]
MKLKLILKLQGRGLKLLLDRKRRCSNIVFRRLSASLDSSISGQISSLPQSQIAVASGYALPIQIQMQGPSAAGTIDQIYFLRHYSETRDTVDLLKQRKLEVESGSAFVEASQISVDDFPNEVQYLQTLVDRDPEAQKELGNSNSSYSYISQRAEEELTDELKRWRDLADYQASLLAQLRMTCTECGCVLSASSVNEKCPGSDIRNNQSLIDGEYSDMEDAGNWSGDNDNQSPNSQRSDTASGESDNSESNLDREDKFRHTQKSRDKYSRDRRSHSRSGRKSSTGKMQSPGTAARSISAGQKQQETTQFSRTKPDYFPVPQHHVTKDRRTPLPHHHFVPIKSSRR